MEEQRITEETWDYLFILDACRYDFFKEAYGDFLVGELQKKKSRGSHTLEWAKKNFQDENEDIVYLSSNPYINSTDMSFEGWKARDHFSKILDLWLDEWDEERGTVHPERIKRRVDRANDEVDEDDRMIVHFLQPHRPFLKYEDRMRWSCNREKVLNKDDADFTQDLFKEKNIFGSLKQRVGQVWKGNTVSWKFRKSLGMKEKGEWEGIWRDVGKEGIEELYEENLKLVLKTVEELSRKLKGRMIVTADHGECLGERSTWGHPPHRDMDVLRTVPWLVLKDD